MDSENRFFYDTEDSNYYMLEVYENKARLYMLNMDTMKLNYILDIHSVMELAPRFYDREIRNLSKQEEAKIRLLGFVNA